MPKPPRMHSRVPKPFTPEGLSSNIGWHGTPGARHIPAVGDPLLPPFISVVSEWRAAGIEMTDELMAAALKLARLNLDKARRKVAQINAAREREAETQAALDALKPGTFGEAPNGVVYYIRRGRYVKIGTTTNLRARLRDLMPDEVLAVEPGSYLLESQLHAQFANIRYRPDREYFELTPELQAHIDAIVGKHGSPPPDLPQFDAGT